VDGGVSFEPIDFDKPDYEQPVYNVIIHKITEDIRSDDEDSKAKVKLLQSYLARNPKTVIVDPLSCVENVITRSRVCRVLEKIINSTTSARGFCPFTQPKYLIVDDVNSLVSKVKASSLQFPLICKPIEACGTPNSHSMVIAVSPDGLELVNSPCVIQEYRDHSASFFKVYVIDEEVMVYQRPSLPDLEQLRAGGSHSRNRSGCDLHLRSIAFDSRYAYPTIEDFIDSTYTGATCSSNVSVSPIPSEDESIPGCGSPSEDPVLVSSSSGLTEFPTFSDVLSHDHTKHKSNNILTDNFVTKLQTPNSPNTLWCESPQLPQCEVGHLPRLDDDLVSTLKSYNRFRKPSAADLESADLGGRFNVEKFPHKERFERIAEDLREGFGLTLFGFDVILPKTYHRNSDDALDFVVIDVNFFPSYKEVEDFPSRLRQFLRRRAGLQPYIDDEH